MKNFDAALFDIDGTLLDTTEFVYGSFRSSLLTHMHKEFTWEEISPVLGKSLKECYQLLSGLEMVDHLIEGHRAFQNQEIHLQLVKAYPQAVETLSQLRDNGIRIAAVTSRGGENLLKTLKIGGIAPYLEMVVTDTDVKIHKPDPEGIMKALTFLHIPPERAVMIGDTNIDILAGKNAGVKTIGVTYGFHSRRVIEANPDYVVDTVAEVLPVILGKQTSL
jgi:pyrophosphatase PpaX